MNHLRKLIRDYPYELLAGIAILVFFLFKLSDVPIPYHWDEMGVYARAAFRMLDTGHISLMPGSLDPELSRGHPLLFTFSNAVVFKIFGASVTTGHLFSLFLAVATLVLVFITAKAAFGKKTAFFATLLLCAQPIFFCMSVQVLPEMMLTLFTMISAYGILKDKWIIYAIAASLAIMTKETAIVIPGAALIVLLADSLRSRDFFTRKRFLRFVSGATPLIVFGIFLLIQKAQNGWFFFPEHMGYIHLTAAKLPAEAGRLFNDMFTDQGRWLLGIPFLAGTVLAFFPKQINTEPKGRIFLIFVLIILLTFAFSLVNYYLTRYIVFVIPFIILGGTWTVLLLFEKMYEHLRILQWTAIIFFFGYGALLGHKNMFKSPKTCDMSYHYVVNVSRDAIKWAEENWRNETFETNFPIFQGVEDPRNGYLSGKPLSFTIDFKEPVRYGMFFFLWETSNIPNGLNRKYRILKTFDEEWAHVAAVEYLQADTLQPKNNNQ